MRRILCLMSLAVLWGGAAGAQESPAPGALEALLACRGLADGSARLACFDKAASGLAAAQAGGAVVVVDRAKVEAARRQAFGFTLPSLADILPEARPGAPSETSRDAVLKQVEAGVVSARPGRDGKWVLTLDNGAVWRQTDTESLLREPRPGSRVVIKAAALGSYLVSVDGQRSFRARREE